MIEHVFNRHQERLVDIALRRGDVGVNCVQQSMELLAPRAGLASFQLFNGLQAAAGNNRNLVTREVVLAEQLANFHLNQLKQLGIVNHVGFVQPDHDRRYAYLAGKQDVLAGLGHGAVGSGNNQNGSVHLSCAGDHVLHVVSVTRAVHVCVVAGIGLILHVRSVDGNAAFPFFWGVVDFLKLLDLGLVVPRQKHGDRSRSGGLTMVNVADGAHVYVRFRPLKLLLSHFVFFHSSRKTLLE